MPLTKLNFLPVLDTDNTTATNNIVGSATNTLVYIEQYTSASNCGANYFAESSSCPICGSKQSLDNQNSEVNVPASSATIDITAQDAD